MNLSPHFTLAEFTHSQTAARYGIDNDPPAHVLPKLAATAAGMELVRALLGKPITVSSGYRSSTLNRLLKGSKSSQHMAGEAVDFTCAAFGTPVDIVAAIVASDIPYDQCILEFGARGWTHISFSERNRKQALIIDSNGSREYA